MPALNQAHRDAVAACLRAHPDWGELRVARATGIPRGSIHRHLVALRAQAPTEPPPALKPPSVQTTAEGATCDVVSPNPRTLDDLLAACQVDLTVWEVERFTANKWEVALKTGKGDQVKALHRPLYQIKAWLKRRQPVLDAYTAAEVFRGLLPKLIKPVKLKSPAAVVGDLLYEISIPDLHLGKLAWSKETGHADYDSKIAARVYMEAMDGLLATRPPHVARFLLPLGNDFFNVDSDAKTTTAGTPQDEDSRWQKSFKAGCALALEAIRKLALIAPVDVIMVSGNHDYQRVFYLGVFLEAAFGASPDVVTISNEPTQRKYYQWGDTLLGFTHGDKEKQDDLPLIMASERPDLWAGTKTREWHLGHEHKEKVKSKCGVTVRVIPSLCAPESWHASRGYVGGLRQACAFVYDRQGLTGLYFQTVREG